MKSIDLNFSKTRVNVSNMIKINNVNHSYKKYEIPTKPYGLMEGRPFPCLYDFK